MLFEAVVEFKYDATEPDELTLQVGQVVKVMAEVDEGWWKGELDGKVGLFPSNFVKKVERAKAPSLPVAMPVAAAAAAVPVAAPVAAASGSTRKVKVTFDYKAVDEDELTLRVGDIITVLGEESEGWWKGEINGKFGSFPSNFVTEYKEEAEEQGPETKLKKIGVPTGGIGSLFGGGIPQLKKRNTMIMDQPKPEPTPAQPAQPALPTLKKSPSVGLELKKEAVPLPAGGPPPVTPSPAATASTAVKIRKARVTFAYIASDEDELTLVVGDILTITGEESEGWWRGTDASGRSGAFPNNFVEEFWETIETKPTPPKVARPPAEAPKPAKPVEVPKPEVAVAAKPPVSSRLSKAESSDGTPALIGAKPVLPKPTPAPAPAADASATNTGGTRPASPPPLFEKKKFNTPAAAARPTTTVEVDGELMKKLSVRSAASEGDAPPSNISPSKPEPAPASSLPPKPTPVGLPPKPTPVALPAKPAPALPTVSEQHDSSESLDSPSEDSPKLHHATKDRPKIGSNRRKPQRRSFSAGGGSSHSEEGDSEPPAEPPKPQLPTRTSVFSAQPSEPEPKLPEKPKVAVAGKPSLGASAPAEPHTLPELKEWFQQELAALKRELSEERAARKALEDRLSRLEARK